MSEPTQYISGLMSSINWDEVIDKLIQVKRNQVITPLEKDREALNQKLSLWGSLKEKLSSLRDSLWDFYMGYSFQNYKVLLSAQGVDPQSVMEVSASRFAEETSYQLEVLQLAQADVWASKTFSSQDQALGLEGLLRINGLEIQISPEDTLQTIRDKINSLGGDFKASIIKVNEGEFVLFLKGEKTGETNALTLEDPNDLFGFQNLIQAQDALLKVNGLMVQRPSNTINDLFKGLTIQLKRALPGTTISLEVKRDTDSLIGKIEDFVNAYNQVVSFFNQQFSYQEGTIKPLMGDVTLRGIKSTLVSLILQKADLPEGLNALTFIGINLQKDGSLTFNKEAFLEKFSMDPENTSSLLQKVSTNLKEYLDKLITPFSGLLNVKTDILQRQIQRINEQIDRQQYLIEQEKERLRRQFLALEEALGQLKSLSNWLSQQIEISFKNSK